MQAQRLAQVMKRSISSSALGLLIGKGADWTTINPRHIFRALLRECTYLPDSAARHYFRHHIINRFRRYNPRPPVPADLTERLQQLPVRKHILKSARKALVFLKRANTGYRPHLIKALSMTYGREGRRKRELMHEIICRTLPGEKALSPLVSPIQVVDKGPALGKQLEALAISQGFRTMLRPTIPTTNIWGRPTPVKRVQNLKDKWYANTLSKIVPPLPEQEWERLRDLSSGRIRWEGPVQRRKRAATTAHDWVGDQACADLSGSLGISLGHDNMPSFKPERQGNSVNPHTLTTRFMRRIWTEIFLQCPMMTWDAVQDKWIVKHIRLKRIKKTKVRPVEHPDLSIFEGVNAKGKIT